MGTARVREWGLRDRHDRGIGHALCEVWSPAHGRWLLLDPGRGVAAIGPGDEPLGVRELVDGVAGGRSGTVRLKPLGAAPVEAEGALASDELLLHPDRVWFLLAGYQPLRADRILRHCPPMPLVVGHALTLLAGSHPRYLVYHPRPDARRPRRSGATEWS